MTEHEQDTLDLEILALADMGWAIFDIAEMVEQPADYVAHVIAIDAELFSDEPLLGRLH